MPAVRKSSPTIPSSQACSPSRGRRRRRAALERSMALVQTRRPFPRARPFPPSDFRLVCGGSYLPVRGAEAGKLLSERSREGELVVSPRLAPFGRRSREAWPEVDAAGPGDSVGPLSDRSLPLAFAPSRRVDAEEGVLLRPLAAGGLPEGGPLEFERSLLLEFAASGLAAFRRFLAGAGGDDVSEADCANAAELLAIDTAKANTRETVWVMMGPPAQLRPTGILPRTILYLPAFIAACHCLMKSRRLVWSR